MRWFIDTLVGWWVLLLVVSCGLSAICYELFLKHLMK
jgi:hypothetical protein